MRFSIRSLFTVVILVAFTCGWFSTWRQVDRERTRYAQQLHFLREELARAKEQLQDLARQRMPDRTRSFWEAELDGTNLTGMTIRSSSNAFQSASFRSCKLDNATLAGGVASFQLANFNAANLSYANLSGADASFQGATFVGAELTGAKLAGGPGSFQGASFEDAILVGATLDGNFQAVNISGVKLQGADISALECENLASCYFDRPPTYNAKTKFPAGFDPKVHLWIRGE